MATRSTRAKTNARTEHLATRSKANRRAEQLATRAKTNGRTEQLLQVPAPKTDPETGVVQPFLMDCLPKYDSGWVTDLQGTREPAASTASVWLKANPGKTLKDCPDSRLARVSARDVTQYNARRETPDWEGALLAANGWPSGNPIELAVYIPQESAPSRICEWRYIGAFPHEIDGDTARTPRMFPAVAKGCDWHYAKRMGEAAHPDGDEHQKYAVAHHDKHARAWAQATGPLKHYTTRQTGSTHFKHYVEFNGFLFYVPVSDLKKLKTNVQFEISQADKAIMLHRKALEHRARYA